MLETCDSMEIVNETLIPALDKAGELLKRKDFFFLS